jgi:hypothetical protein
VGGGRNLLVSQFVEIGLLWKTIREATRSGFIRGIWRGLVDRSYSNPQEHTKRNSDTADIAEPLAGEV